MMDNPIIPKAGFSLLGNRFLRVATLSAVFIFACVLKNSGILQQTDAYRVEFHSNYAAAVAAKAGGDIYSPEKVAALARDAGVTGFLFPFTSSPVAAYAAIPLTWFSSRDAQSIWLWISVLLTALTLTIVVEASRRFVPVSEQKKHVLLFAFFGIIFVYFLPFSHNLELGEISVACVPLLALCLFFFLRGDDFYAGFFLGAACLLKGSLIVLLVYFIARKRYRVIAGAAGAFIALVLFTAALGGWRFWPEYFTLVFRTVSGGVHTGPSPTDINNISIFGFLTRLFGTGALALSFYAATAVLAPAALFFWTRKLKTDGSADIAFLPFAGLAVVLAPVAFVYHIPLLLPAVLTAFARIWAGFEISAKALFAALLTAFAFFCGIMFPRFCNSIFIPGWCAPFVTSLNLWFILGLSCVGYIAAGRMAERNGMANDGREVSFSAKELFSYSRYALLILCVVFIGIASLVILIRITYPFELEWLEGESLQLCNLVMDGETLYSKPGIEFTPAIYTPLFFYVGALFSSIFGLSLPAIRAVSLVSLLGAVWLIYSFAKKETSSRFWGAVAVGFFAATFRTGGAWFDIARVDMLFLVFCLGAVYIVRWASSPKMLAAAGLLMFLAFFTKQAGILPALALSIYLVMKNQRRSLYFILGFWPAAVAIVIVMNNFTGGWFFYFVFDLPAQQKTIEWLYTGFWKYDIMGRLPILSILSLAFLFFMLAKKEHDSLLFYSLLAGAFLIGSWMMRVKVGGYENTLVPVFALIAIMAAASAARLLELIESVSGDDIRKYLSAAFVFIICSIQMLTLTYNIPEQIPNSGDYFAGKTVVEKIKNIQGDVWIPAAGYLAIMAGKPSYMHLMTYADISAGKPNNPVKVELDREIAKNISGGRFDAIITHDDFYFKNEIQASYKPAGIIIQGKDDFFPVTGSAVRPNQIFIRK
jgi:uncharacterized membrane protein